MRLFLIKRKSDGAFLRTLETHYSLHTGQDKTAWLPKPSMMPRTPDGVAMNLRKLCSTPYQLGDWPHSEVGWRDFRPDDLGLYEIISIDVDVISMKATPAKEFAQIDAIETIPLNRAERQAAQTEGE